MLFKAGYKNFIDHLHITENVIGIRELVLFANRLRRGEEVADPFYHLSSLSVPIRAPLLRRGVGRGHLRGAEQGTCSWGERVGLYRFLCYIHNDIACKHTVKYQWDCM